MTIENKELYDLFFNVSKADTMKRLIIEGFNGGINVYATDMAAVFKKTFYGDNAKEFAVRFDGWQVKTGTVDVSILEKTSEADCDRMLEVTKAYFADSRFWTITAGAKEFKQAVKGADAIHRGESAYNRKHRFTVISAHGGKIDLASWTASELEQAVWQLEGDFTANGAVFISTRYLERIKPIGGLEISYGEYTGKGYLHIHSSYGANMVICERKKEEEAAKFASVLEYEYRRPEKAAEPIAIEEPEAVIEQEAEVTTEEPDVMDWLRSELEAAKKREDDIFWSKL